MPLASPPPLQPPTLPIVVRRAYRAAPAFEAGGRRTVRLAARAGQRIAAPCAGGVRFAGRVAGGPPVITVGCGALGLRVTVGGVTQAVRRGSVVRAGGPLGRAVGREVGLSVRRVGAGYVDPIPLLGRPIRDRPASPIGQRTEQRRWQPVSVTTLSIEAVASPSGSATADRADRWLGFGGVASGAAALMLWLALRARATRYPARAPHRARRAGRA